jgi:hypothetical protein
MGDGNDDDDDGDDVNWAFSFHTERGKSSRNDESLGFAIT